MNLEDRLEKAFDAWANARRELGEMRKQATAGGGTGQGAAGGQLAQSPEVMALFQRIDEQEAECHQLYQELTAVGEQVADARQTREVAEQVERILREAPGQ